MTHGALRVSAIALGAAALVSLSPLSAATAATVVHHPAHAVHGRAGHAYGRVAHAHGHHYVWRNGHRYAYGYGYNPGAAVAAGVIGGVLGAAAGYPYDCGGYYLRADLWFLLRLLRFGVPVLRLRLWMGSGLLWRLRWLWRLRPRLPRRRRSASPAEASATWAALAALIGRLRRRSLRRRPLRRRRRTSTAKLTIRMSFGRPFGRPFTYRRQTRRILFDGPSRSGGPVVSTKTSADRNRRRTAMRSAASPSRQINARRHAWPPQ